MQADNSADKGWALLQLQARAQGSNISLGGPHAMLGPIHVRMAKAWADAVIRA